MGNTGYLICLNCETDFVAKNNDFEIFANAIIDLAVNNSSSNLDELLIPTMGSDLTVAEKITEQSGVIGEKIEIYFERICWKGSCLQPSR